MKNLFFAFVTVIITLACETSCSSQLSVQSTQSIPQTSPRAVVGAEQLDLLLPKLQGKRVGLVVNHTSLVGKTHLADTLKSRGVDIKKIFAPEHGFRGSAADGEHVKDGMDVKTGYPIVSLYGANRKPTAEQFSGLDVLIFDIQDVGTRFYTYISTMHYVMETCAELNQKVIILDRPNPNGSYVDGPILDPAVKSFIGMHPIPTVHGLTVGELAKMINEEGWLANKVKCDFDVITIKNWKHADFYSLPVRPSPNLPSDQAIKLYPSLALFEGTQISVGRGTQTPFLVIGNPLLKDLPYTFTPVKIPGMSVDPPQENKRCYGLDLSKAEARYEFTLKWLLDMYQRYPEKDKFFIASFDRLAGNKVLQQQIKDGLTEAQIRKTWEPGLSNYKTMRKKYLLYED